MDSEELIKKNLEAINEDYEILKPNIKKWLQQIEGVIQERKKMQDEAIKTIKSVDYSIKSIATEIGASRTTLYNHEQLLKRYIEQSISIADSANPYSLVEKVQSEKALLQDQIAKMMEHDLDNELLRVQNKELSTSLEGKNAEINRLQKRIEELSKENHLLKKGTSQLSQPKVFPKK